MQSNSINLFGKFKHKRCVVCTYPIVFVKDCWMKKSKKTGKVYMLNIHYFGDCKAKVIASDVSVWDWHKKSLVK